MMGEVRYKDGYGFIDGYKFRKDPKTGYYLSTKKIGNSRIRLHIYVWQKHNGPVPTGMEINHIDENKNNNEIENLECLTRKEHLAYHKEHDYERMLPVWNKSLNEKARPAAAEWHKSEQGRIANSKAHKGLRLKKKYIKRCVACGKVFRSAFNRTKFCSPNCQSAYRRKTKKDNETRKCIICGKPFSVSKYSKTDTCSAKCRSKKNLLKSKADKRGTTRLKSGKFIGQASFMGKKYHTSVYDTEHEAHQARNLLIEKIIKEN